MELAFGGLSGIVVLLAYGALMLAVGLITYLRNRGIHESLGGGSRVRAGVHRQHHSHGRRAPAADLEAPAE